MLAKLPGFALSASHGSASRVATRGYLPRVHPTRNHFLPPDPDAFKRERPSHGRVIVIAPTSTPSSFN